MGSTAQYENQLDTGLAGLVLLLRFHGVSATADQIRHQYGRSGNLFDLASMIRCAKALGLKASAVQVRSDRLGRTPLPALASLSDGSYVVIGGARDGKVLLQDVTSGKPSVQELTTFKKTWSGSLLLLARRVSLADSDRAFGISWFIASIHRYRGILAEALIASFFLQIFGLVSPLFFQVVVDKVLVHRGESTLDVLIIGLILVSVFETILSIMRTYIFSHTTNRVDVELGTRLFRHLFGLPLAYFQARRAGDTVARMRELDNIRQFITGSALTLVMDLLFTFVFLAVMAWYSEALTEIVLLGFPFYIGITLAVMPTFRQRLQDKFKRFADNQSFLVETVTGVETIKAMAVEPQMHQTWEDQLAGYVSASFAASNLGNWASQSIGLVSKISMGLILWFGAHAVMRNTMTIGELCAFNMLAQRVTQPVLRLAQMWQDFQQTKVSIDRLGDVLNSKCEASVGHTNRSALPRIRGNIRFEQATFRYRPDGSTVLNGINLTVPVGQVVGIVGASGSGKSTLAKLVQRLYVLESGRILVDDVDLAVADATWLRRQVGVVLQENILFNRSVRENIALIDPAMPLDRVIAAAKLAGAHEFISELPEAYDTKVGERGDRLSGGQRQRVAIARALIGDPRILIFDEATSALDYESEYAIQANMRDICRGRTVLIIAHRLSTVRGADRIITMDRGCVVEDGSHLDLIRKGGRYASLHRIQAGEAIHEAV